MQEFALPLEVVAFQVVGFMSQILSALHRFSYRQAPPLLSSHLYSNVHHLGMQGSWQFDESTGS